MERGYGRVDPDNRASVQVCRTAIAFSPDRKHLVGIAGSSVLIFDLDKDGSNFRELENDRAIDFFSLSRDGQRILLKLVNVRETRSGSRMERPQAPAVDNFVRVKDMQTGQLITDLAGHGGAIVSAEFSPNGRFVMTSSKDRSVRIWRMLSTSTGERAAPPMGFGGQAKIDNENTQALIERAKATVPRCLNRDERVAAFLDPAPPEWCIDLHKPPYDTEPWVSWLADRRAGKSTPIPPEL